MLLLPARMARRYGFRAGLLSFIFLSALSGCREEANEAGNVSMQLSTTAAGVTYRLRDATFTVTQAGSTVTTISTEDDPTVTSVQRTLAVGGYSINLASGWRLEKQTATGFQTVSAQLASPNPVTFTITSGQSTPVAYAFQTDGSVVVIGNGTLTLTIGVTDTSVALGGIWDSSTSLWDMALWQ
jgi:hypothetical protein